MNCFIFQAREPGDTKGSGGGFALRLGGDGGRASGGGGGGAGRGIDRTGVAIVWTRPGMRGSAG